MIAEVAWGDMEDVADEASPGPLDRLLAAEAAWLAIPPRRRPQSFSAILVGVGLAWDGTVVGYTPRYMAVCPACHDHPIGRCLVCSASDEDPARWPMMDLKERARLLAGPPLRKRVTKANTRRQKRATTQPKAVA